MKRLILCGFAALALAGCATSGGLQIGGSGSPTGNTVAFVDKDLENAEAIYVAAGDTVAAPCPPALEKWVNSLPGGATGFTISGAASGIAAIDVTLNNGVTAKLPDYVDTACGGLLLRDVSEFNRLLALVASVHP